MEAKLKSLETRYHALEDEMSRPETIADQNRFKNINREHSHLSPVIQKYGDYKRMTKELSDNRELILQEKDPEMREMLQSEIESLEKGIEDLKEKLLIMLLPKDPNSGKDVIMEIRAGTGGDEAALFAADLFRMYTRYIDKKGWRFEFIDSSTNELGGFREVIFSVRSPEAYDNLKFESGVHRVQRVPTTEAGGRIHTSAVTVAVLTEAEEDEIVIDPNELRIDVYRSSGHGGQSVNTTDSAVRITHIPSGMVVTCQDEKSQLKNKVKAMRVLRARLLEQSNRERQARESEERRSQVGSGDRSERIRTYNYPQSRMTDHRIGLTLYSLEHVMEGEIDGIIEGLRKHEIEGLLKTTI